MGGLASLLSPSTVRSLVRASPAYVQNRNRVAALAADGLTVVDTYTKARPWLFAAGLAGMAASAYLAWKRKGARWETWAAYGASFTASAALAYLTRPGSFGADGATAPGAEGPGFVGWVDTRVEKYKAEMGPQFADKVLANVTSRVPGWQDVDPTIQAVVV